MIDYIELAQRLAADFATRADEADRLGQLPPQDIAALKASGYLGLSVPREYGGQGSSVRECVEAQLELAQGSASTAMVTTMQLHVFGYAAETRPWSGSIFETFCRMAVQDGALFNSVASEPQLGSPSRGGLPETSVEPVDGGWRLNGHKTWTTGGRYLNHMLVRARLDDQPAVLWVPGDSPGIEWVETWRHALSLRASESHDVYFRDVCVPAEHLIQRGKDHLSAQNAWFPLIYTATYLGAAFAARSALIRYALERVPTALGRPIATLPGIQRQIGEVDVILQAARALLFDVAQAWADSRPEDRARLYPRVAAAKSFVIDAACTATEKALRAAGGPSLTPALSLERHFRDVRAGLMHPPSGDLALELVGQAAIAESK